MAENANTRVAGTFKSYMTQADYKQRAEAQVCKCDPIVPPAAKSVVGTCEFYYRPLHCEYTEMVEKVSLSSISVAYAYAAIKVFSRTFNPWTDLTVAQRLLHRREKLIEPECTDSDWSRHSNFMMRHIGCGHKPPAYYLSYGYYYCSNYGAHLKPNLSQAGKKWLDSARWYLQRNIEIGLKQNMQGNSIRIRSSKPGNGSVSMEVSQYNLELDDKIFKKFAFNTHPMAYLDAGLAGLPIVDLAIVTYGPNAQEWVDLGTYKQAIESGQVVVGGWVDNPSAAYEISKDDLARRVSDALKSLIKSRE